MRLNKTIVTNVPAALTEIGRFQIPAGLETIGVSIRTANVAAFNAFQVRAQIGGENFTVASAAAAFTTPTAPIIRASGDLTALAANAAGYFVLDVRGMSEVTVFATCASAGPTAVTVQAQG